MDDLISRKAAIAFANDQIEKETGAYSKGRNAGIRIMKSALNNPDAIPSVHAVPLDKICKWLEDNATLTYGAHISAKGWEYILPAWMEEQDAAD